MDQWLAGVKGRREVSVARKGQQEGSWWRWDALHLDCTDVKILVVTQC